MRIFNLNELLKIITIEKPKVSDNRFLYEFLSLNKDFILKNCKDFTVEDLWYSEYYYLMCLKNENEYHFGYDAGFEQMCFDLLQVIQNIIKIDWNIVCDLEEKASKNWYRECKI